MKIFSVAGLIYSLAMYAGTTHIAYLVGAFLWLALYIFFSWDDLA